MQTCNNWSLMSLLYETADFPHGFCCFQIAFRRKTGYEISFIWHTFRLLRNDAVRNRPIDWSTVKQRKRKQFNALVACLLTSQHVCWLIAARLTCNLSRELNQTRTTSRAEFGTSFFLSVFVNSKAGQTTIEHSPNRIHPNRLSFVWASTKTLNDLRREIKK